MVGIASEWDRRLNRIVRHRVELGLADEKDEADEKKKRLRSAKVNEAGMGPRVRRERLVERARGGGTSGGGDKCVESVGHEVETLFAVRVEWDWLADTTLRRCPSAKLGKRERVSATNTTHTHTHARTRTHRPRCPAFSVPVVTSPLALALSDDSHSHAHIRFIMKLLVSTVHSLGPARVLG